MIRNLEYYRAFYYTATLCSFSDAAAKLYVTQSAVSQAVKKLESELNCKLFERNASPIRLTEAGKSLLAHVTMAFQELERGEQELLEWRAQKKLKVGATETTLHYGVPERLKAYQNEHPEVTIQLCGSTTPELLDMLKEREMEAAFLIVNREMLHDLRLKGLKVQRLTQVQDRIVASAELGLDSKKEWSLRELSAFPFVSPSEKSSVFQLIRRWFLQNDLIFNPLYTAVSTAQVLKMVESGMGIGVLPENLIAQSVASGNLQILNTSSLPEPRQLILAGNGESQLWFR